MPPLQAVRSLQDEITAGSGAQPDEPVPESELTGAELVELAQRIREAAGVGDIMDVKATVEGLPAGFPHRARLAGMAEDFDLEGLLRLARELEQRAG